MIEAFENLRLRKGAEDYISAAEIAERTKEIGSYFSDKFASSGIERVQFVALAHGGVFFGTDLARAITGVDLRWSMQQTSKPGAGTINAGDVSVITEPEFDPAGEHILVGDDVIDGGHTLAKITRSLRLAGALSVFVASLCMKPENYNPDVGIESDDTQVGFMVADRFLVGAGMDWRRYKDQPGLYRNFPHLTVAEQNEEGLWLPIVLREPSL